MDDSKQNTVRVAIRRDAKKVLKKSVRLNQIGFDLEGNMVHHVCPFRGSR